MSLDYYDSKSWQACAKYIKGKARRRMGRLIPCLYPKGTRIGDRWLIGDKHGNPGTALSIELVGRDAGTGRDATTGARLDLIDLWKAARGVSFHAALYEIEHWRAPRKPRRSRCTDAPNAGGDPGPITPP
jgi:hypothetical protein